MADLIFSPEASSRSAPAVQKRPSPPSAPPRLAAGLPVAPRGKTFIEKAQEDYERCTEIIANNWLSLANRDAMLVLLGEKLSIAQSTQTDDDLYTTYYCINAFMASWWNAPKLTAIIQGTLAELRANRLVRQSSADSANRRIQRLERNVRDQQTTIDDQKEKIDALTQNLSDALAGVKTSHSDVEKLLQAFGKTEAESTLATDDAEETSEEFQQYSQSYDPRMIGGRSS